MDHRRFRSFEEFWPFYVGEHSKPGTRALHVAGTSLVLLSVASALALGDPRLLLAAPLVGYGLAWIGHFTVERNRPATFTHPLWSLRGDFRMFRLVVTGRMGRELARLEARGGTAPPGRGARRG